MIICAWCGSECDGSIFFVLKAEVLFTGGLEDETSAYETFSKTSECKRFCSAEHRLAWFREP